MVGRGVRGERGVRVRKAGCPLIRLGTALAGGIAIFVNHRIFYNAKDEFGVDVATGCALLFVRPDEMPLILEIADRFDGIATINEVSPGSEYHDFIKHLEDVG